MDDQYQVYINRLMGMIRLEHYQNQWNHIQPSPKFEVAADGTIQPVVFPGYSIITPPGTEDPLNAGFFSQLETMQRQIWDSTQGLADGLAVALPAQTFHLTIADLIWDANYRQQIQNIPDYEVRLQNAIGDIFSQQPNTGRPIRLRVLGFILMTRAIAVCLAPNTETDYQQILNLRRSLYQNPGLLALGMDQQYNFTAHITLGYFSQPEGRSRDAVQFSQYLDHLNDSFLEDFPEFQLQTVELRKFENMTHFSRQPSWPTWSF